MKENMQNMSENMSAYARKYAGKYVKYAEYAEYDSIILGHIAKFKLGIFCIF